MSNGHFATFDESLPGTIIPTVLTADGLTFYCEIVSAQNPDDVGICSTTRASTSADFPAGTLLPADIQQAFMQLSGVSSDQLTAFFTDNEWNMHVVSRPSKAAPWSATPNGSPTPPILYHFGGIPTADCRFLFTECTQGGLGQTDVCELPRL